MTSSWWSTAWPEDAVKIVNDCCPNQQTWKLVIMLTQGGRSNRRTSSSTRRRKRRDKATAASLADASVCLHVLSLPRCGFPHCLHLCCCIHSRVAAVFVSGSGSAVELRKQQPLMRVCLRCGWLRFTRAPIACSAYVCSCLVDGMHSTSVIVLSCGTRLSHRCPQCVWLFTLALTDGSRGAYCISLHVVLWLRFLCCQRMIALALSCSSSFKGVCFPHSHEEWVLLLRFFVGCHIVAAGCCLLLVVRRLHLQQCFPQGRGGAVQSPSPHSFPSAVVWWCNIPCSIHCGADILCYIHTQTRAHAHTHTYSLPTCLRILSLVPTANQGVSLLSGYPHHPRHNSQPPCTLQSFPQSISPVSHWMHSCVLHYSCHIHNQHASNLSCNLHYTDTSAWPPSQQFPSS